MQGLALLRQDFLCWRSLCARAMLFGGGLGTHMMFMMYHNL